MRFFAFEPVFEISVIILKPVERYEDHPELSFKESDAYCHNRLASLPALYLVGLAVGYACSIWNGSKEKSTMMKRAMVFGIFNYVQSHFKNNTNNRAFAGFQL
jgi:hypothetical protein